MEQIYYLLLPFIVIGGPIFLWHEIEKILNIEENMRLIHEKKRIKYLRKMERERR